MAAVDCGNVVMSLKMIQSTVATGVLCYRVFTCVHGSTAD